MTKYHKNIALILLLLINTISVLGQPPDEPLRPEEWIQKMGNGNWMIFHIPQDDFGFADVSFSPEILDSLKAAGYTGGRLHWQARALVDSVSHLIDTASVSYMSWIMDELAARDMAVCFQYDCLEKDEPYLMDSVAKSKYFTTWKQLCIAFKDKSHLVAMCPVIEFHGWEYLKDLSLESNDDKYMQQVFDSTNWFYNECTTILREHNPTRIASYKPWGAAKRMEFEQLAFPFDANHPNPDSGYYVASGSGSYGMGDWSDYGIWSANTLEDLKWQAVTAGLGKAEFGIHHGVEWRETTGIQFWIDHWEPAYWKRPGEWTDEQNLVYTDFFLDTLQSLGIASSGPQTRRFWNNDDSRFMTDQFSRDFLSISAAHCWRGPLVYPAWDTINYSLNVVITGSGDVNLSPDHHEEGYKKGTDVVLTAIPESGWEFAGWLGDVEGMDNPVEINISSDYEVQAVFVKQSGEEWITDTLVPVADAFVQFNKPDENFGSQNNIVIKSTSDLKFNRNGLIRFDLSEIEGEIHHAELLLTCKEVADDPEALLSVFSVTDDSWTESEVTWNTAPELVNMLDSVSQITSEHEVYSFDVSSFAALELTGDKLMSLKISDGNLKGDLFQVFSREDSLYFPQLLIKREDTNEEDTTSTISVHQNTADSFQVYPNPVRDILYIESSLPENRFSEIRITSLNGNISYREKMEGNSIQIDLTGFMNGIYLLLIETPEGVITKKIVLCHH